MERAKNYANLVQNPHLLKKIGLFIDFFELLSYYTPKGLVYGFVQ